MTPGKIVKRYLAGVLDARTHKLIWVEADRKTGPLFVRLLWKLVGHYRRAKVIHVILDNCSIHNTSLVATSLNAPAGRKIQLHFLPPYCPDDNRIERFWNLDLTKATYSMPNKNQEKSLFCEKSIFGIGDCSATIIPPL